MSPLIIQTPSYPTRSLNFLKALRRRGTSAKASDEIKNPSPSPLTLNVLVVGAGLGGLAVGIALARRGHTVTIFEQASQMGEVSDSELCVTSVIADSMLGGRRHPSAVECEPAALTMGPGAFTRG